MHIKLLNKLLKTFHIKRCSMALFTQILNPITGQNEWETHNDYDYHQEIANAGFGDMLHDRERNQKYYLALRRTIDKIHAKGQKVHVLDIGTGTGILSMMAVEAGADTVTACEAFLPMANCAERILEANDMCNKVRLIKKRSTELKLGQDMPRKANLLVTEVLDTELIGEGAIGIYNHAHDELLTDDVICIPSIAKCYAQVVQSSLAAQWNSFKVVSNLDGNILIKPPKELLECKGEAGLHDLQMSQLPLEQIRPITEPIEVFVFDFNHKVKRETQRSSNLVVKSICPGSTDLVFYWWSIKMDLEGDILLSCAPFWAHPELKALTLNKSAELPVPNIIPWRDHWMQAVYYIPKPLQITSSDTEFILNCNHDEFSLWFDAFPLGKDSDQLIQRHACSCSFHMTYSRTRIGQMNQAKRNKRFLGYLEESLQKDSNILSIGDGCVVGLLCAKLGVSSVLCYEPHRFSRHFMESLVQHNNLSNVQFIDKLDTMQDSTLVQLTHIFAEPYFLTSILPWDNFYFGTLLLKIRERLSPTVQISPNCAKIFAVPVEFLDLHKIRSPVGQCEGFDLSLFDEMVQTSSNLVESKVDAQPLWEYPCRALAKPQEVLNVIFKSFDDNKAIDGIINIESSGVCNGIALWVDWNIDGSASAKSIVSTGPTEVIVPGQFIKWDMFVRQGVHLVRNGESVQQNVSTVLWAVDFKPLSGQINFSFNVNAK